MSSDSILYEQYSYNLLSGMVYNEETDNKDTVRGNIHYIKARLNQNIFEGKYNALYKIIMNAWKYNSFITEEYLLNTLKVNMGNLIKVYGNEDWAKGDDQPTQIATEIYSLYQECLEKDADTSEFKMNLEFFVNLHKSIKLRKELYEQHMNLSKSELTNEVYNKIVSDIQNKTMKINSIENEEGAGSNRIVISSETYGEKEVGGVPYRKLGKYGLIKYDENYIHPGTGMLVTIIGESKAGKTRYAVQMVHEAVLEGTDVGIGAIEMRPMQYKSLLLARHIKVTKGITNISDTAINMYLSSKQDEEFDKSLVYNLLNEEQINVIDEAEYDLYNNPKYGLINIFDCTIDYEDLEHKFNMEYDYVPFKMLLIDYPALLGSKTRGKSKTQITSDSFIELKKIANRFKNHGLCVIAPNQMSNDGLDALKKGDELDQSASGDSKEAVKSSDLTIGITKQNVGSEITERRISTIAIRFGEKLPEMVVFCDLGCCFFQNVS